MGHVMGPDGSRHMSHSRNRTAGFGIHLTENSDQTKRQEQHSEMSEKTKNMRIRPRWQSIDHGVGYQTKAMVKARMMKTLTSSGHRATDEEDAISEDHHHLTRHRGISRFKTEFHMVFLVDSTSNQQETQDYEFGTEKRAEQSNHRDVSRIKEQYKRAGGTRGRVAHTAGADTTSVFSLVWVQWLRGRLHSSQYQKIEIEQRPDSRPDL